MDSCSAGEEEYVMLCLRLLPGQWSLDCATFPHKQYSNNNSGPDDQVGRVVGLVINRETNWSLFWSTLLQLFPSLTQPPPKHQQQNSKKDSGRRFGLHPSRLVQ